MRILAIIALVIAAALGCSWFLGSTAEIGIRDYVATISEYPNYQAEVTDYQRGLTHSVATIQIKADVATMLAGMEEEQQESLSSLLMGLEQGMTYIVDIYQGPVVFQNGFYAGLYKADITLDPQSEIFRRTIPGDINLEDYYDLSFNMGFLGKGTLNSSIEPFNTTFDEVVFSFGGIDAKTRLGGFGKTYDMEATVNPLSLISPDESLQFSAIELEGAGRLGHTIADTHISMHMNSISGEGQADVEINDISILFNVDVTSEDTFSSLYSINTGHIDAPDLPEPINHLRMSIGARDMNIEGAMRFYDAYTQAAASADPFAMQMAVTNALGDLFAGKPVFEIQELSFSQGTDTTLDLAAELSFNENIFANPATIQGNPAMALGAANVNVDLAFSQTFMDMALETYINNQFNGIQGMDPAFLEQMRQQQLAQMSAMSTQLTQAGYLIQNGTGYTLKASMSDGQLLMNGNPLPLPF